MAGISGIQTYNPMMMGMKYPISLQRVGDNLDARMMQGVGKIDGMTPVVEGEISSKVSFSSLISDLVSEVDAKDKVSQSEVRKVLSGEVDSLHQSMIAMQEAGVAFSLMVEVRNKLMESYQQVMRMQV